MDTDVHLWTKCALLLVLQGPALTAFTVLTKSVQNNAFYVSKSGLCFRHLRQYFSNVYLKQTVRVTESSPSREHAFFLPTLTPYTYPLTSNRPQETCNQGSKGQWQLVLR